MSERFDFHSHSRVSDGTHSPAELVRVAQRNGVTGFALTDHDTVAGIAEARAEAERLGVELIAGIELSVVEDDGARTMHVLGLGIDESQPALLRRLDEMRRSRETRAERIAEKLRAHGVPLERSHIEAQSPGAAVGRPHIARALVALGVCKDADDAFARWLRKGRPAYEPNAAFSAREAIELVHAAGGAASLAHPPLSGGVDAPGGLDAYVERLAALGLDGVEVWHPNHSASQIKRLRRIAKAHELVETGGSDFHGDDRPDIELGRGRRNGLKLGREVRAALELRIAAVRARAGLLPAERASNLGRPHE
jgi:hypothetical protein